MITRYHLPDCGPLNAELKACILKRREAHPGVTATNRGGWHSEYTLQSWTEEPIRELLDEIRQLKPGYRISTAWANVNERGDFNIRHAHRNHNIWAGYYVVEAGNGPAGGRTVFPDQGLAITPENGLAVLFPADLDHEVEPYEGDGPRITIAFNFQSWVMG
jgi:hypothetical protein